MTEKTAEEIINMVMPKGESYMMPLDWQTEFANAYRKESPSSIVSFLGCPLKWYLERYSDLPGSPSGWSAVLGTFVHRVLEVYYTEPPENRTEEMLDRTFKSAWRVMTDHDAEPTGIIDAGLQEDYYILEEMQLAELDRKVEDGEITLRDGDENAHGMFYGGFYNAAKRNIYAIVDFDGGELNKVDVVSREQWVNLTSNDIRVNGKIDRVIKDETGAIVIQDYKTGRAPEVDDAYLKDENGDAITLKGSDGYIYTMTSSFVPMGIYAVMMREQFDGEIIKLQLYYLSKNVKYVIGMDEAKLDLTQSLVDEVTKEMNKSALSGFLIASKSSEIEEQEDENGNISEVEVPTGHCTWCFASSVCPAYTGETDLEGLRKGLNEMFYEDGSAEDGD